MVEVVRSSCFWLHFGYACKIVSTRYAVGLDEEEKSKRVEDNFKVFGMGNWTDGIFFLREGVDCRRNSLEGKNLV